MRPVAELTKDCLELPSADRMKLARVLLDATELDPASQAEVDAFWEEEIQARIVAIKNGTAQTKTAAEVFDDLDRRHPG